jgi:hypothetical protein
MVVGDNTQTAQAVQVVTSHTHEELNIKQKTPTSRAEHTNNVVTTQEHVAQHQSNTFHNNRNYKGGKHNRSNTQYDRNGHRTNNSRGKYPNAGGNRNSMRNVPNQHNNSNNIGYMAHNQFMAHQTYNQQPYQQIQYDPTAMQQMAIYHQQNMMPQIQMQQQQNGTIMPGNIQNASPGSKVIPNNKTKIHHNNGASNSTKKINSNSQRGSKAPPPGMSSNANADGQAKKMQNNGFANAGQDGTSGSTTPMLSNSGTYPQQNQPQYGPPGMAGYAPSPGYPQGGFYPQQYYGHPGAYYQNTPYPNQRGGYAPPGMAQYNYGSQYGTPSAGQEYNQQSGVQQSGAGQVSGANQATQNVSAQVYGTPTIPNSNAVPPLTQQFVGQYQQNSMLQSNGIPQNVNGSSNSAAGVNPSIVYQQSGPQQGYAHQNAMNQQRAGQW